MKNISTILSQIIKLHKEGNFLKSRPLILEILKKNKKSIEYLKLLSITELQIGNINESIKVISEAIKLDKNIAEFYLIRGYSYMKNLDYQAALIDFEKSIDLNSNLKDSYLNIGVIHTEMKNLKKSIEYFSKVIEIDPHDKRAYSNLAHVKAEMNKYDEALKEINKSINIDGNNLNYYLDRGNFYKKLGQFELSISDFDKVILETKKNGNQKLNKEALYNKSLLKLLLGEFEEGWKLYENRFYIDQNKNFEKFKKEKIFSKISFEKIPFPLNIKDFRNSNLLVICEQGIGEHIIFLPLVNEVSEITKSTTVLIDSRLISLCERSFKNINFLPLGDKNISKESYNNKISLLDKIKFDYQISIGSLSKFFRNSFDDFKRTPNHFFISNDKLKEKIKKELNLDTNKKIIGISWTSFNSSLQYFKNIDLIQLGSIFKELNVVLLNLQYGDVDDEINKFVRATQIPILNTKSFDLKKDLDALTCLIDLCDLVISTDNVTVRLSGAINKDTWLILPDIPLFFYLLNRSSCLWYPSLKLYRQDKRADWSSVLSELRKDLLNRY